MSTTSNHVRFAANQTEKTGEPGPDVRHQTSVRTRKQNLLLWIKSRVKSCSLDLMWTNEHLSFFHLLTIYDPAAAQFSLHSKNICSSPQRLFLGRPASPSSFGNQLLGLENPPKSHKNIGLRRQQRDIKPASVCRFTAWSIRIWPPVATSHRSLMKVSVLLSHNFTRTPQWFTTGSQNRGLTQSFRSYFCSI